MELVDEADHAIAQRAALRFGKGVQVATVDFDAAGVGPVEAAEDLQQRRLARTRRADDGEALAGAHIEVQATQHLERRGALLEAPHHAAARATPAPAPRPWIQSCRSASAG